MYCAPQECLVVKLIADMIFVVQNERLLLLAEHACLGPGPHSDLKLKHFMFRHVLFVLRVL